MKKLFKNSFNNKEKNYLFTNCCVYNLSKISSLYCLIAVLLLSLVPCPILAARQTKNQNNMADTQFTKGLENFGIRLFSELAKTNRQKNIVFSPFSIQTCIAMARMGAEGETALEMDKGLALSAQNPDDLAKHYNSILAVYENSPVLKIANKIYVMQGYEIQAKFNELLTKQFFSSAESLNFAESQKSAAVINGWVESKTNHLIKDLVGPQLLNSDTRLVLVNAIHFKGEWLQQFNEHDTRELDFYLDETNTVKVQMMHVSARFNYGEFDDLDASVLEMRYKDSDLSMLIFLPNSRTGLVDLEEKLKNITLQDVTQRLYNTKVIVDMPKFKAEFEVELNEPLKKMGMSRMFSDSAEFGKMLNSKESIKVSKAIHKAFIEVNEKGTEAAAATVIATRKKRGIEFEMKDFNVDHPFHYKIVHKNASEKLQAMQLVLFEGSTVRPVSSEKEIKDEL